VTSLRRRCARRHARREYRRTQGRGVTGVATRDVGENRCGRPAAAAQQPRVMSNRPPTDEDQTAAAVLDTEALASLRALDPGGQARLVQRVVRAFEAAAARLAPQWRTALAADDTSAARLVAHTLKSSSASVGALVLSRQCAAIEAMIRDGRIVALGARVAEALAELERVQVALRRLPDAGA
jgi:HPt (histidine-containing phosphotransfer) domain-containing protein